MNKKKKGKKREIGRKRNGVIEKKRDREIKKIERERKIEAKGGEKEIRIKIGLERERVKYMKREVDKGGREKKERK